MLPQIMDKVSIFMGNLDALAKSGVEFEMETICINLSIDIIASLTMNMDFGAQGDPAQAHPIVKSFSALLHTYAAKNPLNMYFPDGPMVGLLKRLLAWKVDKYMKQAVRDSFKAIKEARKNLTTANQDRSVLALALQDTEILTPQILQMTANQLKNFFFAGHDTTAIMLQRVIYALLIHPKALAAIRAEHDAVFGSVDPREVFLAGPEQTAKSLPYTSACIKEALRLWPPASSARLAPWGSGFNVRLEDGREVCLDGAVLYINHYLIGRDRRVYGDTVDDFIPERWLNELNLSAADKEGSRPGGGEFPTGAWRAFERGPRSCIGQELAILEAKVILACVMRKYEFTKVGAGEVERDEKGNPIMDEKGKYKVKSELLSVSANSYAAE
jgi:cytochrome P450